MHASANAQPVWTLGQGMGRVGLEKDLNQISMRNKQGLYVCKYYDKKDGRTDGWKLHKKKHVRPF